jgi:hypothetical protein
MHNPAIAEALASAINQGPPMRGPFFTVAQFEDRHPATKGRLRRWILHADAGCAGFDGLRGGVIRIGRSVMLDEASVLQWLNSHAGQPPSSARNPHGRAGKPKAKSRPGRGSR